MYSRTVLGWVNDFSFLSEYVYVKVGKQQACVIASGRALLSLCIVSLCLLGFRAVLEQAGRSVSFFCLPSLCLPGCWEEQRLRLLSVHLLTRHHKLAHRAGARENYLSKTSYESTRPALRPRRFTAGKRVSVWFLSLVSCRSSVQSLLPAAFQHLLGLPKHVFM